MRTFFLYLVTALAGIVGCCLPWPWLRQGASAWLLLPAAASLADLTRIEVTLSSERNE